MRWFRRLLLWGVLATVAGSLGLSTSYAQGLVIWDGVPDDQWNYQQWFDYDDPLLALAEYNLPGESKADCQDRCWDEYSGWNAMCSCLTTSQERAICRSRNSDRYARCLKQCR